MKPLRAKITTLIMHCRRSPQKLLIRWWQDRRWQRHVGSSWRMAGDVCALGEVTMGVK
jgi:hypothetical protein